VQLPRREHFDRKSEAAAAAAAANAGRGDRNEGDGGARIGNPRKHYGRWEMRATFGDGRPFHGPLLEAPGPPVDAAPGQAWRVHTGAVAAAESGEFNNGYGEVNRYGEVNGCREVNGYGHLNGYGEGTEKSEGEMSGRGGVLVSGEGDREGRVKEEREGEHTGRGKGGGGRDGLSLDDRRQGSATQPIGGLPSDGQCQLSAKQSIGGLPSDDECQLIATQPIEGLPLNDECQPSAKQSIRPKGGGGRRELAPRFIDAGAGSPPYRYALVEFLGFDGVHEPVRMPFRARAPTGRRETEVTLKPKPTVFF